MKTSAKNMKNLRVVASSLEKPDEEESEKINTPNISGDLINSFLKSDKKTFENTRIIHEIINQNVVGFVPDRIFENLVKNYSTAKNLYGERLIKLITGYDEKFVEKNINIPEFQRELKKNVEHKLEELKDEKIINKTYSITEKGIELASLILYIEELNRLFSIGSGGENTNKKNSHYGEKAEIRVYRKGDRYKDLALKRSVKIAIKRKHPELLLGDLHTYPRQSKGNAFIIYGLDASASMKGKKMEMCKKAGIALAYKAINRKDNVGLVVFGSEVKDFIAPSNDFSYFINRIARIRASRQTNISAMIKKAAELFPKDSATKHIILLTDAIPTYGVKPIEETLEAISLARANNITISLVGIDLDKKGKRLAKKIALLGEGRLYLVKDLEELDFTVLEDYAQVI